MAASPPPRAPAPFAAACTGRRPPQATRGAAGPRRLERAPAPRRAGLLAAPHAIGCPAADGELGEPMGGEEGPARWRGGSAGAEPGRGRERERPGGRGGGAAAAGCECPGGDGAGPGESRPLTARAAAGVPLSARRCPPCLPPRRPGLRWPRRSPQRGRFGTAAHGQGLVPADPKASGLQAQGQGAACSSAAFGGVSQNPT